MECLVVQWRFLPAARAEQALGECTSARRVSPCRSCLGHNLGGLFQLRTPGSLLFRTRPNSCRPTSKRSRTQHQVEKACSSSNGNSFRSWLRGSGRRTCAKPSCHPSEGDHRKSWMNDRRGFCWRGFPRTLSTSRQSGRELFSYRQVSRWLMAAVMVYSHRVRSIESKQLR